jgi:hypothetical protein
MKTALTLVLALLVSATMAHADDATMKKELVGYWKSKRHAWWYKDNGIVYMLGGGDKSRWDIRNGAFYAGSPIDYSDSGAKILVLNKTTFTIQAPDGPSTRTRITKAEAEVYGLPDKP